MKITLDLDPIPAGKMSEPLPPGRYAVKIQTIRDTTTKNGAPAVNVRFVIQNGNYAGRSIFDTLAITQAGQARLAAFLRCANLPNSGTIDLDTNQWIGRQMILLLEKETYAGRDRNHIARFLPTATTRKAIEQRTAAKKSAHEGNDGSDPQLTCTQ